jgi:SLT domain-containing protein
LANVVEIVVKAKDEASAALKAHEGSIKSIKSAFMGVGGAVAGSGLLSIGAPLAAAGAALGAFGAIAKPSLDAVTGYLGKTGKAAQDAYKQMTPDQRALIGPIKGVETAWAGVQKQLAPVVSKVIGLGANLVKDFLPSIGKLAEAGGKIATAFIGPLDQLVKSKVFSQFIDQVSKLAVQAGQVLAPVLMQLLKVFMNLFIQVGPAGIQLLKALGPLIGDIVQYITPAVTLLGKLVAGFISWLDSNKLLKPVLLGLIPVIALMVGSSGIGSIIIVITGVLAAVAFFQKNWKQIWQDIKNWARDAWEFLTHGWGQFLIPGLTLLVKTVEFVRDHWRSVWNTIQSIVSGARNTIVNTFNGLRNSISSIWNSIWANTVSRVENGISSVVSFIRGLPGKMLNALGNAGSVLAGWGRGVLNGLLAGVKAVWNSVLNFFKGIPGDILHALGIHSPPDWAIDAGKHIMNGIGIGMTAAKGVVKKATSAIASAITGHGEGVTKWIPLISQALKMEGLDSGLLRNVLYQMQTESGGNPLAQNNTDINAAHGDPSRGLMQVIGSTFDAYHWPGTSWNIFDPLANIAAALNYAKHTYGSSLMSGGMGIGSGHGYAAGGPEGSGWSVVGEMGRELVKLPPGSQVYPHANANAMMGSGGPIQIVLTFDRSIAQELSPSQIKAIKAHVRTHGGRGKDSVQTAFGS